MFGEFITSHKTRFSDENGYPEYKAEDMRDAFKAGMEEAERICAERAKINDYAAPALEATKCARAIRKVAESV